MNLTTLFEDKTIKAKQKVALIGDWLLSQELPVDELLAFADTQNATNKASCIEAIEYATKKEKSIANADVFEYVTKSLQENEPRIKWESAKVIGNTAVLFQSNLESAIANLLANTKNDGTVVRWARAYALAEILKLKTPHNTTLIPKLEQLATEEADNGVKKKYTDAFKKVKK